MFKSAISGLNLFGYAIAFAGVMFYNWRKLQAMQAAAVAAAAVRDQESELPEKAPLKRSESQNDS